MANSVRVRYAPSPTGEPHIGNIRSALFNWLFARSSGGAFIVRIEDTDRARLVPGALDAILEGLTWLGLDWDEGPGKDGSYGPYVQSERQAQGLYQRHADWLVEQGKAYLCYCTSDRLEAMRKDQQAAGKSPGYDRTCRELTVGEREERAKENPTPVVRFKMPVGGRATVHDLVRGDVEFDLSLLDDFVLLKSDGFPTYHLANVVDDHLMEISHIMRAEEWLPSAPRHQELYKAFGYDMPPIAHLPIILGPDRSKLSKRHGATSILQYKAEGFLPDAMLNFLALLGWSLDDSTDVISREQLIKHFSLERIVASPAVFNIEKLEWFNGVYIRQMAPDALAEAIVPWLEAAEEIPATAKPIDRSYLLRIIPLERERLRKLSEAPEMLSFFFQEQPLQEPAKLVQKGMDQPSTAQALERALAVAEAVGTWDAPALETAYRALAEEVGVKTGQLFGTIRVAVTGRTAAPPLFETMDVLGRDRCLKRLRHAMDALESARVSG